MKKITLAIMVLIISQLLGVKQAWASDFKLVKKQGAITLYERWIKGTNGGAVRELKAEFTVQGTPGNLLELLRNQAEGLKWNKNASNYRIAEAPNPGQWVNYIKYDMPAIMDDQECCLLYTAPTSFSSPKPSYVIRFSSTRCPVFPDNPKVKRITGVKGEWILEPQSGDKMKVTYLISSDRNKYIPRFLSDPIVRNNLCDTMGEFKKLLEK